ncbi:hypothetical protein ZIOFF_024448 [Zingiber officinale]|uniref:Uncharacterized protein n=1 Tax=Zingiber officinale TaxID=94328 RepID=A0A8J5GYA1_ZINOF|nr:hypothetical protein ZIOFF_024448 [Zingiber officinale]
MTVSYRLFFEMEKGTAMSDDYLWAIPSVMLPWRIEMGLIRSSFSFLLGLGCGVYITQNYEVPNMKQLASGCQGRRTWRKYTENPTKMMTESILRTAIYFCVPANLSLPVGEEIQAPSLGMSIGSSVSNEGDGQEARDSPAKLPQMTAITTLFGFSRKREGSPTPLASISPSGVIVQATMEPR